MSATEVSLVHGRALIKISGEFLAGGSRGVAHDGRVIDDLVDSLRFLLFQDHLQIVIVAGGGNLHRGGGYSGHGDRGAASRSDYVGMLATVVNVGVLYNALLDRGVSNVRAFSSLGGSGGMVEKYAHSAVMSAVSSGAMVLLGGGLGAPFFTTDTAAIVRGAELKCDFVVKATGVDGIYTEDPKVNAEAKFLQSATYKEVIDRNIKVMDLSAVVLARELRLPLVVMHARSLRNLMLVVAQDKTMAGKYTLVA